MEPFTRLDAIAAPLDIAKIDTGMIISNRFTRKQRKPGQDFSRAFLHDLRFDAQGNPIADFVLNWPEYQGARILITGPDFGCGSSRESASYALLDFGVRAVIGTTFGDIFRRNCMQNGIVPVALPQEAIDTLMRLTSSSPGCHVEVDLEAQLVTAPNGSRYSFEIDPMRKQRLLKGLDDVGATLEFKDKLDAFERAYDAELPLLDIRAPARSDNG